MIKILISTTSFAKDDKSLLQDLKKKGFEIVLNPYGRKLTKEEFLSLAKDAVGVIAGTETIDSEVLEKLPELKVISRCGTGLNNVDLKTAEKLNKKVFNTPDAPIVAVAELAVALMLDILRKISLMNSEISTGKWEKKTGNLLTNKKVGIIGFGRIGEKVAQLLGGFNCDIMYFDPYVDKEQLSKKALTMEELLRWAEIISIHISSGNKILGIKELSMTKKGTWIINVSRGGVVDEKALYDLLKSGHLSGAGLDVFENEPYIGPLTELDNIILTPHIGSYAKESRMQMERQSVLNLLKGLRG